MLSRWTRTVDEDRPFLDVPRQIEAAPWPAPLAAVAGPSLADEVAYLSGIDASGRITATSYWSAYAGTTAFKFGTPTAGTGATASYAFDAASGFSATEQATFERALAVWSSVANIRFVRAGSSGSADILLTRGHDEAAYTTSPITRGSGATLGQHNGQSVISIDTSVYGFDLSGSLVTVGGYGFATAVHEIGHAIGLGHGGGYNEGDYATADQFSVYDTTLFTTMSYFSWADRELPYGSTPFAFASNWGYDPAGDERVSAHSAMTADILAAQALYGAPTGGVFATGQTFGFHSTITGPLASVFDFAQNRLPVVTLFSRALGNTLDLSGFGVFSGGTVDMTPGSVSSVGGLTGNVVIAPGTWIDTVIGSQGDDTILGNDHANVIDGGGGFDVIRGGGGNDQLSGGGGTDQLVGGDGDDICFFADSGGPPPSYADGGNGYDKVFCADDNCYVLGVEVLAFSGSADARGRAENNGVAIIIYGNVGNDALTGGGAGDTLFGGDGDDVLTGGDGNDTLKGGDGDDQLWGGFGRNVLVGGFGSDRYEFVSNLDSIVERVGDAGIDEVRTDELVFRLPDGVENLLATNSFRLTLTGNDLANRIDGTSSIYASTLAGGAGADVLLSGSGDDRLDGGTGADRMAGGTGDDRYLVDTLGDTVVELAKGGHDTVVASIAVTLSANLEDLELAGRARSGTGNALANRITGSKGSDALAGGGGDDTLVGGKGADLLTGGSGADRFVFAPGDTGAGVRKADTIADFHQAEHDVIDLSAFAGDGALKFVGQRAFSGAGHEVHFALVDGATFVTGDLDGDKVADFALTLGGEVTLVRGDFLLVADAAI